MWLGIPNDQGTNVVPSGTLNPDAPPPSVPLCVDLDGTLVFTDTLLELAVSAVKDSWLCIFLLPRWLIMGKAYLKRRVAEVGSLDVSTLPYNLAFLQWLKSQAESGRSIYLVTAADESIAREIAAHVGCFDDVMASDGVFNAAGHNKLLLLQNRFGNNFDYAGNAAVDLSIWRSCRLAIVVHASRRVLLAARAAGNVGLVFARPARNPAVLARTLRIHQWAKNVLVFVPLLAARQLANLHLLANSAVVFLAFSLCASSVYIFNDLIDLTSDRRHPTKRRRPLASGDISIPEASVVFVACVAASATLLVWASWPTVAVLAVYFLTTVLYSLYLKRLPLIDVLTLSGLYVLRIIGGHSATSIPYSTWLMSLAIFFLSLALCKRVSELWNSRNMQRLHIPGRDYRVTDLELITMLGVSAGYAAVVLFAIYTESAYVIRLYPQPGLLLILLPVLLSWLSRIWLLAYRGGMDEDPIIFAVRDRFSYGVLAIGWLIFWLASHDWIKIPMFRG